MAEFTEVMRQARRLCAAHVPDECGDINCENCALWCTIGNVSFCRFSGPSFVAVSKVNDSETEAIVMDWAAEHPEPVYPNWEEGWRQLFPDSKFAPCPDCFGLKYRVDECVSGLTCTACKARPMPVEVAEKLGIKPTTKDHAIKHSCDNCKYARRKPTDEPCVRCNHCCIDFVESILPAQDLWEAAK